MKSNEQLINNIIGQLGGIKKMLDEKRDCLDVLTQVKATRSALNALANKLTAASIMNCAKPTNARDKVLLEKLLKELSDN